MKTRGGRHDSIADSSPSRKRDPGHAPRRHDVSRETSHSHATWRTRRPSANTTDDTDQLMHEEAPARLVPTHSSATALFSAATDELKSDYRIPDGKADKHTSSRRTHRSEVAA